MPQTKTPEWLPAFEDPRTRSDFQPEYYPRANGRTAPPIRATGRNDCVVLAFLAVYYELNCAYAALLEARKRPKSPKGNQAEGKHLRAIERVLIARDELEDHCAPFGVLAEPNVENGFTVDVACSFGNVDAWGRSRAELLTFTTYVPIPLPKLTRFQDLPIRIGGPGVPPNTSR
jgi:hypothetical protein